MNDYSYLKLKEKKSKLKKIMLLGMFFAPGREKKKSNMQFLT